jgi:hypothetical protein
MLCLYAVKITNTLPPKTQIHHIWALSWLPTSIGTVSGKLACLIYGFRGFNFSNLRLISSGGTNLPWICGLPAMRPAFGSFGEGEEMTFGSFRFLFLTSREDACLWRMRLQKCRFMLWWALALHVSMPTPWSGSVVDFSGVQKQWLREGLALSHRLSCPHPQGLEAWAFGAFMCAQWCPSHEVDMLMPCIDK